jgi:putative transposase
MQRFKSPRRAQRFLSAHSMIYGYFQSRRYLLTAAQYQLACAEAFRVWQQKTCARTTVWQCMRLDDASQRGC